MASVAAATAALPLASPLPRAPVLSTLGFSRSTLIQTHEAQQDVRTRAIQRQRWTQRKCDSDGHKKHAKARDILYIYIYIMLTWARWSWAARRR